MTGTEQTGFYRRRVDVVLVLVGLAVTALCGAFASGALPAWERGVFRALNNLSHKYELATWPLQQIGMALAVPIGSLLLARVSKSWRTPAALVATSTVLGWGAANLIRETVQRGRPSSFLDGVQLGYDVPDAGPAFPSGHAIVVWALIVVLAPYLRNPTVIVLSVLALGVMACRIYVGAHMPLDTLGGAAYGVAVGGISNLMGGFSRASRVVIMVRHG